MLILSLIFKKKLQHQQVHNFISGTLLSQLVEIRKVNKTIVVNWHSLIQCLIHRNKVCQINPNNFLHFA